MKSQRCRPPTPQSRPLKRALDAIVEWHRAHERREDMQAVCLRQIEDYAGSGHEGLWSDHGGHSRASDESLNVGLSVGAKAGHPPRRLRMQGDPTQTMLEKLRHLLPPDRLAEVEDFIDFLLSRAATSARTAPRPAPDFPIIGVGRWPDDLSLHREDMYGGDGR